MVEVGRDLWKLGDTWFHPLFASFLSLSLARNSLFIHAGLLDISSAFVFDGMEPSLTWGKPSIFIRFLGLSFPPRPHLLRLFWADSEDAESVLTKSVIVSLLFTLLSAPRCLNCSQGCLWLSGAQEAPHFQCLWGLWELSFQKDFVVSVIQEPPGLLMPVVLFLQEITSQFTFSLN